MRLSTEMKSHTGLSSFRLSCERTVKGTLSFLRLPTESPLKLMKDFLFHLQSCFSLSRYLNFCLYFSPRRKTA